MKFGLRRCIEDTAYEIREFYISKDEGVSLMNRYEGEFPNKYFKDFLNYLEITEDKFWKVVDGWRSTNLWEKVNNNLKFKYPIK